MWFFWVGVMDWVVVELSSGVKAAVWFDRTSRTVRTDHRGLRETVFRDGVTDYYGRNRYPYDGRSFLVAVFDHLFLRGYPVLWGKATTEQ